MTVANKPIHDPADGRVACYNRKNYDFKNLKARSLAWFVQIAIRRDMRACANVWQQRNDPRIQLQGHLELFSKRNDLETLIRQRHIVDEADLATIGLTLYNFPTLSHFFVAQKKQAFVREATVRELIDECNYVCTLVSKSRLAAYIPGDKNCQEVSAEEALSLVNQMTPATVEKEAGVQSEDIRKERFLLVDMAAPVTVLTQQFLDVLEREARLKGRAYDDWEEYGILPYLDLDSWGKHHDTKIKARIRAELIYPRRLSAYGPKKIDETTRPHIAKLMDEKGPVFRSLIADASGEFQATLARVREEKPDLTNPMVEEALVRWFPRTYPFNLPDLERASRIFSEHRDGLQQLIDKIKNGQLKLTLVERIRSESEADGTAVLRTMEALRGERAYVLPVIPEDDDEDAYPEEHNRYSGSDRELPVDFDSDPMVEEEGVSDDRDSTLQDQEHEARMLPLRKAIEQGLSSMFSDPKENAEFMQELRDELDSNGSFQSR